MCRGATLCSGLPPTSCQAFGPRFELKLTDPNECIECEELWKTGALFGGLFVCFLLAITIYIRLMLRNPHAVKKWVSTTVIVIGHTQTLSLIGLLRLGWPKSAEVVTDALPVLTLSPGLSLLLSKSPHTPSHTGCPTFAMRSPLVARAHETVPVASQ